MCNCPGPSGPSGALELIWPTPHPKKARVRPLASRVRDVLPRTPKSLRRVSTGTDQTRSQKACKLTWHDGLRNESCSRAESELLTSNKITQLLHDPSHVHLTGHSTGHWVNREAPWRQNQRMMPNTYEPTKVRGPF